MAKIQISLSRAHKLVERLKSKAGVAFAEAGRLATPIVMSSKWTADQSVKVDERAVKVDALLKEGFLYSQEVVRLRAAIGAENDKRGIGAMLAEQDGANQMVARLGALIQSADSTSAMTINEFKSYEPLSASSSSYSLGVSVLVLGKDAVAAIKAQMEEAQRKSFAISDQIAEANAQRFTIELDEKVAQEILG